jgi:hypothetical protein
MPRTPKGDDGHDVEKRAGRSPAKSTASTRTVHLAGTASSAPFWPGFFGQGVDEDSPPVFATHRGLMTCEERRGAEGGWRPFGWRGQKFDQAIDLERIEAFMMAASCLARHAQARHAILVAHIGLPFVPGAHRQHSPARCSRRRRPRYGSIERLRGRPRRGCRSTSKCRPPAIYRHQLGRSCRVRQCFTLMIGRPAGGETPALAIESA